MSLYLGDSLISQLYVGTTAANTTNITLSTPTLSVNSSTGVVTATVTQSNAGYLVPSSASNTLQLTTQAAATITPTAARQTAVAAGKYTIGEVAVAAVPTETKTVTSNGTYSPTSGKFFSSVTVNVPVGSTINNQDKTVTPTTSSQSVSADYGYTGLGLVTVNAIPSQYIIPTGSQTVVSNNTYDVTNLAELVVNVPIGSTINNQNKTITPTETSQSVTADTGYTGLGTVTVNAIPSTYVGSGVTQRTSTDLTTSGATVSVPAGYYSSAVSKSVTSGSAGTPTATKGTVNNNSISITPAVTNTTGYITGGTKTGNAVNVSASELVSGNKAITSNGTNIDVTNYATVSVNVPTGSTINNQNKTVDPTESSQSIMADSGYTGLGTVTVNAIASDYVGSGVTKRTSSNLTVSEATITAPAGYYSSAASKSVASGSAGTPIAAKGTVNNHSISITPSVTNTTGYIDGGTINGTAVQVTASELVSGNQTVIENSTYDVTNLASIIVNVAGGNKVSSFTLIGTKIFENVAEYTDTTNAESMDTGINIKNTDYAWGYVVITCDTPITTTSEWGMSVCSWGRYTTNNALMSLQSSMLKGADTFSKASMVSSTAGSASYGVGILNNTSNVVLSRKCHGTGCPKIRGGNYTVKVYGMVDTGTGNELNLQAKTNIIPTTSSQTISADNGYDGLSSVQINAIPSNYIIPSGNKAITANGTGIDVTNYATVSVNVPTGGTINNQNKTVNPTESQQQITADSGYTGLGTVTINPISSTYIGSDILENSSTDLIVNGKTVTAPAGYYAADASASVAEMTLPTAASSTRSGTTKATIGRSTAAQYINIPVGYNSTAASYTISAVNNGSVTAPSTISGTAATVSAETNTLTLTKTISVTPNVTTAGYISAGTAGNSSVSLTATVTTKAAATITPGTSNQTIAAGTYLTGAQTISGDADLVAGNIKSGVNIFGVAGTYTGEAGLDTSDATATAADLLYNKTAYVDGSKITGTMPNNGATGGTITIQGGTYTIPAGYTSGGTVTANLATGSTTAANISGAAFEESTGDYGFRASVQIQPGYYSSATTVTKDFSTILPAPQTEGTSAQVLAGYDLYNHEGQVISGTMTNNSIGTITLDQTTTSYTIPAGYHNGTGKVQHTTVDIPDPTISVNSSTGVITASGSWTRGFTTDDNYSNTYNLTTLGATTYNVSTSNQTISSGRYLTGNQTIRAVTTSNITAANIKAGVTIQVGDSADADRILGVTGTFTSDANATAADINSGITAYVNGNKITGTQTFSTIHTGSSAPASSVGANGDVYLVLA